MVSQPKLQYSISSPCPPPIPPTPHTCTNARTHTHTHINPTLSLTLSLLMSSVYTCFCRPVRDPTDPLMCLANQTTTPMQLKPDYSSSLWSGTESTERVAGDSALSQHAHTDSEFQSGESSASGRRGPLGSGLFQCEIKSSAVGQNVLYLLIATLSTEGT